MWKVRNDVFFCVPIGGGVGVDRFDSCIKVIRVFHLNYM